MKKVVGISALIALAAVLVYIGATAFLKTPAPTQYTVRAAANRLVAQFGPSLASQGTIITAWRCAALVGGKPTASAATGTEFVCILSLIEGKKNACQGVQFTYEPGSTSVKVTGGQRLAARACA